MNPEPTTAWNVILTIGVLLSLAVNAVAVFRGNRREVEILPGVVAKEEFNRHVESNANDHRDIFSKLGGVDRGAAKKISDESLVLHNRINSLDKAVGGLETAAEMTNQRLVQIDAKIDRLIERT